MDGHTEAEAAGDAENSCDMVSNAPIAGGAEAFNTYGSGLGNAALLARYGFMLDGNEHDVVRWTAAEVWAAAGGAEGLAEAVRVAGTWRGYAGWAESERVVNGGGGGVTGKVGAGDGDGSATGTDVGVEGDVDVDVEGGGLLLCVTGDGAISHGLWALCALGVVAGSGWAGEDVMRVLVMAAEHQVQMEKVAAGETVEGTGAVEGTTAEEVREM